MQALEPKKEYKMEEDIKECGLCNLWKEHDKTQYELHGYEAITNYGTCEKTGNVHPEHDDCDCDAFEPKDE